MHLEQLKFFGDEQSGPQPPHERVRIALRYYAANPIRDTTSELEHDLQLRDPRNTHTLRCNVALLQIGIVAAVRSMVIGLEIPEHLRGELVHELSGYIRVIAESMLLMGDDVLACESWLRRNYPV